MKLALVVAVLVGGPLALIVWGLSRRYARDLFIESAIKPPVEKFGKLTSAEYDALLKVAERRRGDMEEHRRRAALAATGEAGPREVRRRA